jgi:hypothetical protein
MSFLSQIGKGLAAGLITGSGAGGLTAMFTDSFWAGMGVGVADNISSGWLSSGFNNAWNGNVGWGGFYGGGPGNTHAYDLGFNAVTMYAGGYNTWGW